MLKNTLKKIYRYSAFFHILPSRMTPEKAKKILEEYSPNPSTTCVGNNLLTPIYDLQIIIPAFNAESYLSDCLDSVVNQQTEYSFIATVINDGSTDRTAEILEKYQKNYPSIFEIITQNNQGHSGARNQALNVLKGRKITFLDSDDVLEVGAIQSLMDASHGMDIVQGSWYTFENRHQNNNKHICDAKSLSGYPWGKVFRAEVLEKFRFPDGYWFEDTPISFILYGQKLNTKVIKEVVYGYRINPDGITSKSIESKRCIESYYITELCLREFSAFGVPYDDRAYRYFLKQCKMNWGRAKKRPKEVREAIFILESELKKIYFNDKTIAKENTELKAIEETLEHKLFSKFEVIVRVW